MSRLSEISAAACERRLSSVSTKNLLAQQVSVRARCHAVGSQGMASARIRRTRPLFCSINRYVPSQFIGGRTVEESAANLCLSGTGHSICNGCVNTRTVRNHLPIRAANPPLLCRRADAAGSRSVHRIGMLPVTSAP